MNDKIKRIVDKLCEHIKKKAYLFFVVTLIILFTIPILIWLMYFIGDIWIGIPTSITSGELLGFYGSFLSFIGTVALGAVALWQNNVLSRKNDEYSKAIQEFEKRKLLPFFSLNEGQGGNGNYSNWQTKLKNVTNNSAANINIKDFKILDSELREINLTKPIKIHKTALSANESTDIEFNSPPLNGKNITFEFKLMYTDIFYIEHQLNVKGILLDSANTANKINFSMLEEEPNNA